jgi:hypothetical protein
MEEKLEFGSEKERYFEEKTKLETLLQDIIFHRDNFPVSFEKRLNNARKKTHIKKLDRFELMNNSGWNFESILFDIESYCGMELDLIEEINLLLAESFEELFQEDYLYSLASEGIRDWILIMNTLIAKNKSQFEYYLKEMKDSKSLFEVEIANWIEEVYVELGDLDSRYFLDLFFENNRHIGSVILKLQEIPFCLSKYFDSNSNQRFVTKLHDLQEQMTYPPRHTD